MTEDLELKIVSGPPAYARHTDKPVEHITLQRADGEIMGYIYCNDDDDAAGWVPRAGASPEASNDASFWIRILQDARKRGLKPSEALDAMMRTANPKSHVVAGSRTRSENLDSLRALAAAA